MKTADLIAIDTHTHLEVSCRNPFDSYGEEYDRAADKYFRSSRRPTMAESLAFYRQKKIGFVMFTVLMVGQPASKFWDFVTPVMVGFGVLTTSRSTSSSRPDSMVTVSDTRRPFCPGTSYTPPAATSDVCCSVASTRSRAVLPLVASTTA